MNYSKKGVKSKQRNMQATGSKWGRKLILVILNLALIGVISAGIIAASASFGIFKGVIDTSPDIGGIDVVPSGFKSFAYDREGNQITELVAQNSNRIPVGKDMIPQHLADAFVAIEDGRFYEHNGIDIKGIIRAAYVGITERDFSQGASTITQQLLKNQVFIGWVTEVSFAEKAKRKIQEQYLALELEKTMSKADILVHYMNSINLGQNTLGVQAASQRYFDKSVKDLTLSESAVIASITQNPTRLNPISNPANNDERRRKVLRNMLDLGFITESEYDEAINDDVYARIQIIEEKGDPNAVNSYFVDALIDELMQDFLAAGYSEAAAFSYMYTGGLKIFTTLDPEIQRICDEVFLNEENYPSNVRWLLTYELTIEKEDGTRQNHSTEMFTSFFAQNDRSFNRLFSSQDQAHEAIETYKEAVMESGDAVAGERINLTPQPQVSITIQNQHTGHVLAMVGGRGEKTASRTLNRAVSTRRQPGSCFKMLAAFAPALDSAGHTLATVQNDAPFNYADGRPVGNWWGREYRGLASYRDAIRDSMNIVTVKALTQITPQLGFDYLLNFGFTTLVERMEQTSGGRTVILTDIGQALALGGITHGVTNLEMNAAYAAIANSGTYIKPKLYTKVLDYDGNVLLDNTEPESRQVIKESTAFLLTHAMIDVLTSGTGGRASFPNMTIAGKTGSTTGYNDIWFSGYTPYYTATVWTGYDNNIDMPGEAERAISRNLWRMVMQQIHERLENRTFPIPHDITTATICSRSGKLPIPGICEHRGTLRTEYFAEGTAPTDFCNAHYPGMICQYTMLPASEHCPFKVPGVLDILPPEDPSLLAGSGTEALNVEDDFFHQEVINEDGTISFNMIPLTNVIRCPHNWEFYLNPDAHNIIEQQRGEMSAAHHAAIMAAQEAAAAEAAAAMYTGDTGGE
ncbi:MAG: transglycosylase domain-containing protein [Lachnospiraceae bacterium]|nr:transglycosylase domain-containing protein [Lachnospiraceae bacterium]